MSEKFSFEQDLPNNPEQVNHSGHKVRQISRRQFVKRVTGGLAALKFNQAIPPDIQMQLQQALDELAKRHADSLESQSATQLESTPSHLQPDETPLTNTPQSNMTEDEPQLQEDSIAEYDILSADDIQNNQEYLEDLFEEEVVETRQNSELDDNQNNYRDIPSDGDKKQSWGLTPQNAAEKLAIGSAALILSTGTGLILHEVVKEDRKIKASRAHTIEDLPSSRQLKSWKQAHGYDDKTKQWQEVDFRAEIQQIKDLPTEQKLQAIVDLQQAYLDMQQNLAGLHKELAGMVEQNPGVDISILNSYLESESVRLGLPQYIKDRAHQALQVFNERRGEVGNIVDQALSPSELIESYFGFAPQGEVDVEYMPTSIYVTFLDSTDYERAHGGANAASSGGFYQPGKVFAVQKGRSSRFKGRRTKEHETQHALYDMVYKSLKIEWGKYPIISEVSVEQRINEIAETRQWQQLITDYFRQFRYEHIDPRVKDEILAYATNRMPLSQPNAARILLEGKDSGGLYDYAAEDGIDSALNWLGQVINEHSGHIELEPTQTASQIIEQIRDKVIRQEYAILVRLGTEIIDNLTHLGYPRQEVIKLLTTEELHHWPALERKIIASIKQKPHARAGR